MPRKWRDFLFSEAPVPSLARRRGQSIALVRFGAGCGDDVTDRHGDFHPDISSERYHRDHRGDEAARRDQEVLRPLLRFCPPIRCSFWHRPRAAGLIHGNTTARGSPARVLQGRRAAACRRHNGATIAGSAGTYWAAPSLSWGTTPPSGTANHDQGQEDRVDRSGVACGHA